MRLDTTTTRAPATLEARPLRAAMPPLVPLLALLALALCFSLLPAPPEPPPPVVDVQPPHQWQPGVLRVGVDASYPPFAAERDGRFRGHEIELALLLGRHLGREVTFVNIPYDGVYDALRVSRIDVIISALPRVPEFDGTVIYSRPYFQAGEVLIVPAGSQIRRPRDLAGQTVGVELGSLGDQTGRRLLAEGATFRLRSDFLTPEAALAALRQGEIQAALMDRVSALTLVGDAPDLIIAGQAITDVPYHIAMPYDAPEFAAEINAWLAAAERDGLLADLTRRHLIHPTTP